MKNHDKTMKNYQKTMDNLYIGVQSWFLSAAPAASPKIQNPWGGKSMGWEILGKSMSKSRIFGNPDFGKKSRFENELVVFFEFF